MPTTNPNGRVLYEGPSLLDGVPIVVIATGFAESSANGKTGGMLQTWILRQDIPPHHAFRTEDGYSVCGDCPHRLNATCYVRWYQAPLAIWNCWHHGAGYAPAAPSDFDDRILRIGSAGDPCAVPPEVWLPLLSRVAAHTGYTQQWRTELAAWARGVLQASCHGFADYLEATAHGWSTFLVTPADIPDPDGTIHCAASTERGHKTTCAACTLCDGATANVVIHAHGSRASRVALRN